MGVLCLVLVLLFSTLDPSSFATILIGKREDWLLYLNCLPDVLWLLGYHGGDSRDLSGLKWRILVKTRRFS